MIKLTLERQVYLAFIFALILLLTLGYFGYRSANSVTEALKWETHSQEVFLQLDDVIKLTLDAETGGRGFTITGREDFLESYKLAAPTIGERVSNLRQLIADNPQQTAELNKLENLIAEKFDFIKNTSEIRRNQGLEAAIKLTESGTGKKIMDEIRLSIGRMKDAEKNLLVKREKDLSDSIANALRILFFGTVAGIVSLGLANFAIFREFRKRHTAENKLLNVNKDLEKHVEERTHELSKKNDELKEQIKQREFTENRHKIALEAGNLGTWMLDPHTNKIEIDERGISLFGFSAENFDGNAFGRVHEEDYPRIEELFQKSVKDKAFFDAEFRVLTADGNLRWNNCVGQPILDENGKVAHIVGNCRDITDVKENDTFIRQSEIFRRAILDSLSAHIAVLDNEGNIVAVNNAWEKFAEENCVEDKIISTGIGQNYLEVCENSRAFDNQIEEIIENLREVLNGESDGFSIEYPCHAPDKERWFILQANVLKSKKGGAVVSHIDISARKKAEAELKNSEEFTRSIFENSPDCVKVLELDGTLHSMNKNGLCILEIDDFQIFVGKQWIDFWEGDENELAYQAVKAAREGKNANFEGLCKTAKGTLRYWDVSVAPIFDSDGKPIRLISTSHDITERREAERIREDLLEREQAARKEAEIANRMRDEFLATVSHELRAPLNSILGWGKLLEKGNLDEKNTYKAVQTIIRNAEAQNRLIEDLLDVSRIISGKLRLEVITIKPIIFVEAALESVRPAAEAKGITLEIIEDSVVSHISGDPNRLQQVVWNLLSNAIKFTPNDGKVTVEIKRMNGHTDIRIKDTGIGISPEFLPHVFDRFRQADASSIRKFGGLGLGLAIVRHIAEMHGGTVSALSEGENQGSTFIVSLPVIAVPREEIESNNTTKAMSEATPKLSLDGLLILVVDDEEDTRQLLVQTLTFYGATVATAKSAAEGLSELQEKNPDVLVSDIGMPEEDGYSLIRKVRALSDEHQKNTIAIALTAFTRAQDRMRALAAGYQNHVGKPVEPDELATVIASLTGRLQMDES